jgi:hypothetical protein
MAETAACKGAQIVSTQALQFGKRSKDNPTSLAAFAQPLQDEVARLRRKLSDALELGAVTPAAEANVKGAIKLLLAVQPEVVAMWPAASTALGKQCQLWVKKRLEHLTDPRQAEEAGEQVQGIAMGLVKLSWMLPELVSMPARCPAGCKVY